MKMSSFWISILGFLHPKINTIGWDELLTSGVAVVYIPEIFKIVFSEIKKNQALFKLRLVYINTKK